MALRIAPDKKKHFLVGIPLGVLLQFLSFYLLPYQPASASVLSFIALTAICYGFELFSLITGKGHYEIIDAIAGVLGGLAGMAISWAIYSFG